MKRVIILFLLFFLSNLSAIDLSFLKPKNNRLYTEFNFEKSSPFLKKSIKGNGYIAIDGNNSKNKENKFIYCQEKPSKIKILLKDGKIFYSKDNNPYIEINIIQENEIIYFFTEENIEKFFKIVVNGNSYFFYPIEGAKFYGKITEIIVNRAFENGENIVKSIILKYVNKTVISYNFFNIVTGKEIDEKLFK